MTSPKLRGISTLYRALSDQDRAEALALLSSIRYAAHLPAIPDVFAIIPPEATQSQADDIARAMLNRVATTLVSEAAQGDYESDLSLEGDERSTTRIGLPFPILAVLSLIRGPFGGQVPSDLVGVLNSYPSSDDGDSYRTSKSGALALAGDEEDRILEGGFFSKLKSVASKVGSIASAVKNSPLGGLAMKALKVVPGVGSIVSGIDMVSSLMNSKGGSMVKGLANSALGQNLKKTVLGAASSAIQAAPGLPSHTIGAKTAASILANPDELIDALDQTFGADKVTDVMFQILAAAGDFVDDVMTGAVVTGPSITAYTPGVDSALSGDWQDTARSLLSSTYNAYQNMVNNTKSAGTEVFSKLDPKVQKYLNENWKTLAGGAAGLSGTALLYYGTSKYMKNKEAEAKSRLMQAKIEQAKKQAAAQRESLEKSRAARASAKPSVQPAPPPASPGGFEPSGMSGLPPLPSSFESGSPIPGGTGGPSSADLTASFIKVPFAGTVMTNLQGEGVRLFNAWRDSLLSVNPALLTGDLPLSSYDDMGAVFLVHGFPIRQVNVIYSEDIPLLDAEIAAGYKITSPGLTKRIISAGLQLTDPRASHSGISVRDKGGFVKWSDKAFIIDDNPFPKLRDPKIARHIPSRTRQALAADVLSKGEANHCLNSISSLTSGYEH